AVAGPRSEFDHILAREESLQAGVYLLTGTDPASGKAALYIGEAECIKDRIKAHLKKDFWNQVVYFASKDENLTKSHIRYLEGRLIEHAREARRSTIVNGQSSGSRLPEPDREDMEVFLEKIYQLLPVLGVELLVAVSRPPEFGQKARELLVCEIKGIRATGHLVPNGLLVLKGSKAVSTERPSVNKWPGPRHMRQKLLEEGVLIDRVDHLEFTDDAEFSSPSAAAAIVHGGHANGLTAWKDPDGRSLKDMEAR
ncbi:MAG: GIY-YIG nuclease family protein, partial [Thioalkalivibrio sp.]|nr:GIY-YIG nuclease family protein [Thioalkalivibrio sp.]